MDCRPKSHQKVTEPGTWVPGQDTTHIYKKPGHGLPLQLTATSHSWALSAWQVTYFEGPAFPTFGRMPRLQLTKPCSALPSLPGCHVHYPSTLVSENLALCFPSSVRPATLYGKWILRKPFQQSARGREDRSHQGLHRFFSTSQVEPEASVGCYIALSSPRHNVQGVRAHWVLLRANIFLEKVQGFILAPDQIYMKL